MDSTDNFLVTAVSMQVRAEIVSYADGAVHGVLYNKHLGSPRGFTCLVRMVLIMEDLFNSKGFPEAYMSPRAFEATADSNKINEMDDSIIMSDALEAINNTELDGMRCTFEIAVKFRQNATWQGQIHWADKNLKRNFRSALEMLILMNEAMTGDSENRGFAKWDSDAK